MSNKAKKMDGARMRAMPERRHSRRCAFTGRLSVWVGTRRFELKALDASPSAALVEAPQELLRHPERLVGSLCIFPFEAVGYPVGPLRRRIRRFENRGPASSGGQMVLLFD